jgi:hypothetical protein
VGVVLNFGNVPGKYPGRSDGNWVPLGVIISDWTAVCLTSTSSVQRDSWLMQDAREKQCRIKSSVNQSVCQSAESRWIISSR